MKYLLKLAFLFLIQTNSYAQNTFSKIVDYDSLSILSIRNVFLDDTSFYIVTRSRIDSATRTKIISVDTKGDVQTSKILTDIVLNKDAIVKDKLDFYLAGQFVPGKKDVINLSRYSILNDILQSATISDPLLEMQYFSVQKIFKLDNKIYLLGNCNNINNVNEYSSFLMKINSENLTLDTLVINNYGTTNNHFKDIYILDNGNFAVFTEYSNSDYLRNRGLVFFNKDLKEIGSWFNSGDIIRNTLNFKTAITKDSLVLMTFVPDDEQKYESLMAYDLEGNKKWEFTLNYFETMTIHSIQESKSNDILIAGKYDRTLIDGLPSVGFVAKLTKQGKLLWLRSVSNFSGNYEYDGFKFANPASFNTLIELEDEHIMAFGSIDDLYNDGSEFPKTNSNIWMVKLDQDGCLDQDRCNYDVTVNTINNWYIYDQINVLQKEWIFQVTDKFGNKKLINQKFDGDTMLFDNTFDWRKYHQLVTVTSDGEHISTDTLKFRWTREGTLNFMKPWRGNIAYPDSTMYNFALKNGDSFNLPYGFGNATVVKVDSIPLLDGKLRKRIILHHNNEVNHRKFGPLTWIEGIGSPNGLIYYYDWINETKTDLLCYFDRGNKRYSITDAPNCDKLTRNTSFIKVIHPENVWYTFQSYAFSPNSYYDRFSFNGDSLLINEKYYFQLRTSVDSIGDTWTLTDKYAREEEGKIWVLDNGLSGEEILIMDMNLTVGDTFVVEDVLGPNTYYVSNTDVITDLAGIARRVIELKCDVNDEFVRYRWIEGIGPDQGVFETIFEQCVIDGSNNSLTCFYTDEIQHYQTSFNLPCWRSREVNVTDISLLSDINIYPNPGFDQIVIEKGENKNLSYQVYTTTGQVLVSGKMNEEPKFTFSSSDWNSGMYIIRINDANGNYFVAKWIKM